MQRMMRQMQKMQGEMVRIQEEVGSRTVEATSGGGAVTAVASGKGVLTELRISAEAMDPTDPELLADMILTACNEALRKGQEMLAREMSKVAGSVGGLPGLPRP